MELTASSPPNEHEYVATWKSVCREKMTGSESLKLGLTIVSAWAMDTASDKEIVVCCLKTFESSSETSAFSSSRLGGSLRM